MRFFTFPLIILLFVPQLISVVIASEGKGEGNCVTGDMNGLKRMSTSILSSAIVRGPSPGGGRNAWVKYNGLIWTVGMPGAKKTPDMNITTQTELALSQIDDRLVQAGK